MKPILASLLLVAAFTACKGKNKEAPKAGSGSAPAPVAIADAATAMAADAPEAPGSGSGSNTVTASTDPDDFEGPTEKVISEAFGGKAPALPLLSKDGALAAVDLSEPIGLSDMSTYAVGFLDGKQKVERVVLLDDKAAVVEDLKLTDKLKGAATAVNKRLTDGGFTPFEKFVDRQPEDEEAVALGTMGKLSYKQSGEDMGSNPLEVSVMDSTGKQIAKETIKAKPGSKKVGDCGGEPRLGDVWYDSPRKRVLIVVHFMLGSHDCAQIPNLYRMWTLP